MLSRDEVAAKVLDSAADGRAERSLPRLSAFLATVGYLLPVVRRWLTVLMPRRRGARAKARYLKAIERPGEQGQS